MKKRIYIAVNADFTIDGYIRPVKIFWQDGNAYNIDKIKDVERRASETGGGNIRYKCVIEGKERYLFLDQTPLEHIVGARWFVEIDA